MSTLRGVLPTPALRALRGALDRAVGAARAVLARHRLVGALALRLTPSLPATLTRDLLDALCAARPHGAAWPPLDLLTTCALRDTDTDDHLRTLLTFDDVADALERGPLLDHLEARHLTAVAALRPEHIDDPTAGVSAHTLRWMLGAGVVPGLWVPQAAVGVAPAPLRQRLHKATARLRACCGIARPWLATDTPSPDPWLKAAAADLGLPYILTAAPGLWPASPPAATPAAVPRLTLSPHTAPRALYDLLSASPAGLAASILWRQVAGA
jgi:hypothetical protein